MGILSPILFLLFSVFFSFLSPHHPYRDQRWVEPQHAMASSWRHLDVVHVMIYIRRFRQRPLHARHRRHIHIRFRSTGCVSRKDRVAYAALDANDGVGSVPHEHPRGHRVAGSGGPHQHAERPHPTRSAGTPPPAASRPRLLLCPPSQ